VVVHYDGDDWSVVRDDFTVILTEVWGSADDHIFIGAHDGTVLHYDGMTFTSLTGATGSITSIVGGEVTDEVFLFDEAGNWYRYGRAGTEIVVAGQVEGAQNAWATSLSDVWVAAGTSGLQHYDGDVWSPVTLPATADTYDLRAVWGAEDGTLFLGGWGAGGWDSAGLLRRVADEWTDDSVLLTGQEFRDVWALSSDLATPVATVERLRAGTATSGP
jgi:hypothetical protein